MMKSRNAIFTTIFISLIIVIGIMNRPVFSSHIDYSIIQEEYNESFWNKGWWININGSVAKLFNLKEFYSEQGIRLTDDNYIVGSYGYTTTDFECEQITKLDSFCKAHNTQFLYVNLPIKYLEDEYMLEQFGVESFGNQNADTLIERISHQGITVLDLRSKIKEQNLDIKDMFYRTDHHWSVPAGFWASKQIIEKMNLDYNYDIDMDLYDDDKFGFIKYENSWLGEQGRKLSEAYVGKDDFVEIKPNYETEFTYVRTDQNIVEGDFGIFIDEELYDKEMGDDYYPSWHYSYMTGGLEQAAVINQKAVSNKKMLLLCDSYSYVLTPFLALGISEIDTLILREKDVDLQSYIENGEYDIVVVAYAEFMIGAHDNAQSDNYKMFEFIN